VRYLELWAVVNHGACQPHDVEGTGHKKGPAVDELHQDSVGQAKQGNVRGQRELLLNKLLDVSAQRTERKKATYIYSV